MEEYYEEIYNSYLRSGNVELAQTDIESGLAKTLNVDQTEISVTLITEYVDEATNVREAVVTLGAGAYFAEPEVIKEYIRGRLDIECRIIYKSTVE